MEVSGQLHAVAALPAEKNPGTHWIADCVDPKAGPDAEFEKRLFLVLLFFVVFRVTHLEHMPGLNIMIFAK